MSACQGGTAPGGIFPQSIASWQARVQVGAFEREPAKIAAILKRWVGSERAEFDEMARRAAKIGKKWRNALFRIVEDLAAMVAA